MHRVIISGIGVEIPPASIGNDELVASFNAFVERLAPNGLAQRVKLADLAENLNLLWRSDLTPDEVIVFKGYDSDPAEPYGCLHGAFRHPSPGPVIR